VSLSPLVPRSVICPAVPSRYQLCSYQLSTNSRPGHENSRHHHNMYPSAEDRRADLCPAQVEGLRSVGMQVHVCSLTVAGKVR